MPSYSKKFLCQLIVFLQLCCPGKYAGISFIYSIPARVCHIKCEYQHKTFKGLTTKGRCSMEWSFGFKLHIIINENGYISKTLFDKLFVDGIHLITKLCKNMKKSLILTFDKILLRKRALIETVNDEFKNIYEIKHTQTQKL